MHFCVMGDINSKTVGKGQPWHKILFGSRRRDQENEVMRFALVIDAKSDLEDVYLGPESNGKPQELSRGMGMGREWPNQ